MKSTLLLLSVVAVSWALPPIKSFNCIKDCQCKEILPNILDVVECERPLTINSTLFEHLDRRILTVISISNVIINRIEENVFSQFTLLEDVIISKAQIGSVDSKAFNNIKKVKFEDCAFEDNPTLYSESLEELHFASCKLDIVPPLEHLFSLVFLNLSGNYIRELDITAFSELFDLEVLILSNNELTRVPANIFVNNEELNSLYLDNNPLKFFHMNTSNTLETLSLKNCHLTSFDESSTYHLKSLSELNLSHNNITSISGKDFARMSQLSVLDLSYNNLTKLDDDVFQGNPKLQKLTLDGNNLRMLPKFTLNPGAVFQIYTFSCKHCGLIAINKNSFNGMPAIISLQLSYNNLTDIRNAFDSIFSLRILDISYNQIQELPPSIFEHNRNVENLNLAGNPITALNPYVFSVTRAIRKIDASNTKLNKLWANNSTTLDSLKRLIVSNTRLTTLSVEDFKLVPNLQAIDLHNNPLIFDERLCNAIGYLDHLSVYPIEYIDVLDNLDQTLGNDIDNFTTNHWIDLFKKKCGDALNDEDEDEDEEDENINNDVNYKVSHPYDDNYDDEYYTYDEDDDNTEDSVPDGITAEIIEDKNINLARASSVLYVISVFILTALAVLILAVSITLIILRRNSNFNMHQANLPRLKIPLWDTQLGSKKHSGSVYRPLSEDLSGPKTPKCSRYEFSANPTVHTIHS